MAETRKNAKSAGKQIWWVGGAFPWELKRTLAHLEVRNLFRKCGKSGVLNYQKRFCFHLSLSFKEQQETSWEKMMPSWGFFRSKVGYHHNVWNSLSLEFNHPTLEWGLTQKSGHFFLLLLLKGFQQLFAPFSYFPFENGPPIGSVLEVLRQKICCSSAEQKAEIVNSLSAKFL